MEFRSVLVLVATGSLLVGCSEALPAPTIAPDLTGAIVRAEEAAKSARTHAAVIEAEQTRTEELTRRLEAALQEIIAVKQECQSLNARIPKEIKTRVVYVEKKEEPAAIVAPVAPTHSPSFSPSDAPGGTYWRKSDQPAAAPSVTPPPTPMPSAHPAEEAHPQQQSESHSDAPVVEHEGH